jgi:hypothetical protein
MLRRASARLTVSVEGHAGHEEWIMRLLAIGLVALMVGTTAAAAADSGRSHPRSYPRYRHAGPPPWCNQGNSLTGGVMECSYFTLEQCLVTARGVGGTCITNPAYEWARYYSAHPNGWRY